MANKDIHQYRTRGRGNFRIAQHRTAAFERLPSQVGVRVINRLPDNISMIQCSSERSLALKAFYSVDEFMKRMKF
ncbi:hypothetical protein J6590_045562 [Homalodisca vitripennis]|nr:hypothetical protein J6590_045562 [Homalodisca vitripennis]